MPELWFGPDGYLDLSPVPDADVEPLLPSVPGGELAALQEALAATTGALPWSLRPKPWDRPWAQLVEADPDGAGGDALAAAMGGVIEDGPSFAGNGNQVDDLIDPWLGDDAFVQPPPS